MIVQCPSLSCLFNLYLDECIWDVTCCDISALYYFNYWSYHHRICHNCWTRDLLSVHPLTFWIALPLMNVSFFSVRKIRDFNACILSVLLMVLDLLASHTFCHGVVSSTSLLLVLQHQPGNYWQIRVFTNSKQFVFLIWVIFSFHLIYSVWNVSILDCPFFEMGASSGQTKEDDENVGTSGEKSLNVR